MQAHPKTELERGLFNFFLTQDEVDNAKAVIERLGVEDPIRKVIQMASLKPSSRAIDANEVQKVNFKEFGYDIASSLLSKIDRLQEDQLKRVASKHLGQIVQFAGIHIWESVKDHRPKFISEMMEGFKRYNARKKIDKAFVDSMGAGYLMKLENEHQVETQPVGLLLGSGQSAPVDRPRINFNKKHQYGRRQKRLVELMVDHGYVRDKRTIKAFFNAENQAGCRVLCSSSKRNHVVLLMDRLLEEKILVIANGRGRWKTMEATFVDESKKCLSRSFTKLLSKLKSERASKEEVFADVEALMKDFKRT